MKKNKNNKHEPSLVKSNTKTSFINNNLHRIKNIFNNFSFFYLSLLFYIVLIIVIVFFVFKTAKYVYSQYINNNVKAEATISGNFGDIASDVVSDIPFDDVQNITEVVTLYATDTATSSDKISEDVINVASSSIYENLYVADNNFLKSSFDIIKSYLYNIKSLIINSFDNNINEDSKVYEDLHISNVNDNMTLSIPLSLNIDNTQKIFYIEQKSDKRYFSIKDIRDSENPEDFQKIADFYLSYEGVKNRTAIDYAKANLAKYVKDVNGYDLQDIATTTGIKVFESKNNNKIWYIKSIDNWLLIAESDTKDTTIVTVLSNINKK